MGHPVDNKQKAYCFSESLRVEFQSCPRRNICGGKSYANCIHLVILKYIFNSKY